MIRRRGIYDKTKKLKIGLLILVMLIGVVYAALRTGLNINGTTHLQNTRWDVHFENYQATTNSTVTPSTAPSTPSGEKPTTVSYEVTLTNPGDTYEFTLDVVNSGTIDVMIESFSSKLNNTEINNDLPAYLDYTVTYADGIALQNKQKLVHNTTEKIKLRVKYRDDIAPSALPGAPQDLVFNFTMVYVQDDGTSLPVRIDFATATWDEMIALPMRLQTDMEQGTTREVPLDFNQDGESDATCNLRIANISTPAECSNSGFSQTACGLVLECANAITEHKMNSNDTNIGGWPASEMRTYLNDETTNAESIINALPADLRSKIIPTYVVSGHGSNESNNFTSTDKIYLLSIKEVGLNSNMDTAKSPTRTLDYYNAHNNNGARIKKYNNSNSWWWIRTSYYYTSVSFGLIDNEGAASYNIASTSEAVSPAFRIGNLS